MERDEKGTPRLWNHGHLRLLSSIVVKKSGWPPDGTLVLADVLIVSLWLWWLQVQDECLVGDGFTRISLVETLSMANALLVSLWLRWWHAIPGWRPSWRHGSSSSWCLFVFWWLLLMARTWSCIATCASFDDERCCIFMWLHTVYECDGGGLHTYLILVVPRDAGLPFRSVLQLSRMYHMCLCVCVSVGLSNIYPH